LRRFPAWKHGVPLPADCGVDFLGRIVDNKLLGYYYGGLLKLPPLSYAKEGPVYKLASLVFLFFFNTFF
jgi:hypothetical protein